MQPEELVKPMSWQKVVTVNSIITCFALTALLSLHFMFTTHPNTLHPDQVKEKGTVGTHFENGSAASSRPEVASVNLTNNEDSTLMTVAGNNPARFATALGILSDDSRTEEWFDALNLIAISSACTLYRDHIREFVYRDVPTITELMELQDVSAAKVRAVALLGCYGSNYAINELIPLLDLSMSVHVLRGLDKVRFPNKSAYNEEILPQRIVNAALYGLGICSSIEALNVIIDFQDGVRADMEKTFDAMGVEREDPARFNLPEVDELVLAYNGAVDALVVHKMRQQGYSRLEDFFMLERNPSLFLAQYSKVYPYCNPLN
jgi:hypothetical protein